MEGRDIGSVIFPDADFKVYVDCNVETRAKRRTAQLQENGEQVAYEQVLEDLKQRDYLDTHREISPLIMCENAYLIDSTLNNADECLLLVAKEMLRRELLTREFLIEKGFNI